MVRPVPPCPPKIRRVVCNPLILFVRLVVRIVVNLSQIIRRVVWNLLKLLIPKIRLVSSPVPPIPPTHARAREIAPRAKRQGKHHAADTRANRLGSRRCGDLASRQAGHMERTRGHPAIRRRPSARASRASSVGRIGGVNMPDAARACVRKPDTYVARGKFDGRAFCACGD